MSLFRRRRTPEDISVRSDTTRNEDRPQAEALAPTRPHDQSDPRTTQRQQTPQPMRAQAPVPPIETRVPAHIERALITLTTKMQHCIERIDVIENRLEDLHETVMNAPSHSDVLEVRLHSAKLAAELARATVELRGEIGLASDEARRAVRTARNAAEATETAIVLPTDVEIEKAKPIDLTDTEQRNQHPNGWSQSA